jgi:hypothetical protein
VYKLCKFLSVTVAIFQQHYSCLLHGFECDEPTALLSEALGEHLATCHTSL